MSAVHPNERDLSAHPDADRAGRTLSGDTRTVLNALLVFVTVLLVALPLTYLPTAEQASTQETSADPGTAPAQATAPLERVAALPTDARTAVIARLQRLIEQGSYRRAVDVADAYLAESELRRLWRLRSLAQERLAADREKQLVNELKTIPAWQYKLNRDKYAQLVALNPDEPKYHEKLAYYQERYLEDIKGR